MRIEHRIRQITHDNDVVFKTRCRNARDAQQILATMGCHGDPSVSSESRGFVQQTWYHKLWSIEYVTEIK